MRFLTGNFTIKKKLLIGLIVLYITPLLAKSPSQTTEELAKPPAKIIRTCCVFGADLSIARIPFIKKMDIISIQEIGNHYFLGDNKERNGIIYTRKGGFIDLGHLRDYADYTAFLYNKITSCAINGEELFLNLGSEGGKKILYVNNTQNLDSLDIYELAGKIAYDLSLWHEIATWFGNSYIPLIPERYSSFSPEDLYSNLLGIKLGILAIKSNLEYNEAMTRFLLNALIELEAVQSPEATYSAMKRVENLWWNPKKSLPGKKILLTRYLDSGPALLPWLLPETNKIYLPNRLEKPDPALNQYYKLTIKLNNKFPIIGSDSIKPLRTITQENFPWFIHYIENDQKNSNSKFARN